MDPLWAPWRMEFIEGKRPEECIFCTKPKQEELLRENLILSRGERAFIIMNRYPYANGHLLVVPYAHLSRLDDLDREDHGELIRLIEGGMGALRDELHAEGFNVGMNLGKAGGAGIEEHIHYHVVPRWTGDTNFMPVVAETRSIAEHILTTYDRLLPYFSEEAT